MSSKKSAPRSSAGDAQAKKDAVLGGSAKRSPFGTVMVAVMVVALAAAAAAWYANSGSGPAGQAPAQAAAAAPSSQGQAVTLDAAQFEDGKARHFCYQIPGGVTVRYFVVKSSDGVIRAAFDACDVCWRSDKGYTQQGDFMVCNNCGRAFASVQVNEVQGGCNPAPLLRQVADGKVTIQVSDILEGRRFFTFGS